VETPELPDKLVLSGDFSGSTIHPPLVDILGPFNWYQSQVLRVGSLTAWSQEDVEYKC
jgi:hypothetical protein